MSGDKPRTSVEAARLIRADLKKALSGGALGEVPPAVTFSVRAPRLGLARPVLVSIQGAPLDWAFSEGQVSGAASALAWTVRGILGKHWTGRVDVDGRIVCGI